MSSRGPSAGAAHATASRWLLPHPQTHAQKHTDKAPQHLALEIGEHEGLTGLASDLRRRQKAQVTQDPSPGSCSGKAKNKHGAASVVS